MRGRACKHDLMPAGAGWDEQEYGNLESGAWGALATGFMGPAGRFQTSKAARIREFGSKTNPEEPFSRRRSRSRLQARARETGRGSKLMPRGQWGFFLPVDLRFASHRDLFSNPDIVFAGSRSRGKAAGLLRAMGLERHTKLLGPYSRLNPVRVTVRKNWFGNRINKSTSIRVPHCWPRPPFEPR